MQYHQEVQVQYQFKNLLNMANAYIDENGVSTITALLQSDGKTIVRVKVNYQTNGLKMSNGTSGSVTPPIEAPRDENGNTVTMGVSSGDGITPVPLYADSDGNLLIQTT